MQPLRFKDRIAVVTGAAQGIGEALAIRLAREGARVIVADRLERQADAVAQKCRDFAPASSVYVDLRDDNCGTHLVEAALAAHGRVDLAAFCAGVTGMKNWLDITPGDWDYMMEVNLRGTFFCLQAVAKHMIGQGNGGAIVTLASTSGHGPRPDAVHYGASKAGVIHLTRSTALALAPHHIRVNAISPSVVSTPMWEVVKQERSALQGISPDEYEQKAYSQVPLGRPASPEEIAAFAAFLLSEEATYITGQIILQDGGYSLSVA